MEKLFKSFTVYLSLILAITIVLTVIAIPSAKNLAVNLDFLSVNEIAENIKNMELNMTSVVYIKNSDGKWEEYKRLHGDENRLWVSIDKMPKDLLNAFIAIEDETFYKHSGINWKRTLGAAGNYFFEFSDAEFGGSTITQQLIKNITSDNKHDASRKVREIARALLLEKKLSKRQILEAYLNTIALGNGICGVQVAANYYFNKDVSELDLTECATLAAITKNPSRYNPVSGLEANKKRRKAVLKKMVEMHFIEPEALFDTYDVEIKLDNTQVKTYESEINDYFIDTLIEQLIEDLAEKYKCTEELASRMLYSGGYKIYATVQEDIQNTMEEVYLNVNRYFPYKGKDFEGNSVHVQSAMTIVDYSGHIVGIVGGAGEKTVNRGLNRAYNSPRQPGSTMKPIGVYTLAVENDLIQYSSRINDQPIENYYPDGKSGPAEWYGYYKGTVTIDYAIRKSANTIPVIILKELGVEKSYDFLKNKLHCNHLVESDKNLASLALGGCSYGLTTTESAAAYAIFGNGGIYHKPTTYYKVERINGETVLEYDDKGEQVISPATATIMNHLLQGVVYGSEGTGGGIAGYSSMKAYAKTGTSSESKDLWMVAGSPYYVGSVWYGFDRQQNIPAASSAATIWRDVMKKVHTGLQKKEFTDSEDVYKEGSAYYKQGTEQDNTILFGGELITSSEDVSSAETTSSDNSSNATSSATDSQNSDVSSVESNTESDTTESGQGTESGGSSSDSQETSGGDTGSTDSGGTSTGG